MADDPWAQYARTPAGSPTSAAAPAPAADQWAKFARPADQKPQEKTWLDQLTDIPKGLWNNLVQTGQGMVNMATTRPDVTLANIGAAQDAVRLRAEEAFKKGNYAEGVRHVMGWLAPMVGPGLDVSGNKAQAGNWGEATGETLSQAAQIFGPEALARTPLPAALSRTSAKIGPIFESKLNPVQQEAVDFLKSRDVHLDLGTTTGNKFVKGAQSIAEFQPLGAPVAAESARATETGLQRVSGELMREAHPTPTTPESAGTAIQTGLKKTISDLAPEREAAYQDAWQGRGEAQHTESVPVRIESVEDPANPGQMIDQPVMKDVNMPVDVRDIKAQARPILEEMSWMPASERASNAGYRALEKIVEGDDFIPAWAAENGLSGLKSMARLTGQQAKSGMRDVGQGIAAGLVGDLQDGIDAAVAKTGDTAFRGLQKGRATHATMEEIAGLAEKLRDEPVQTFNQMHWAHDTGIDFLRRIQEHAPDQMPEVGRALLKDWFDTATRGGGFGKTRGLLNNWENLGPETRAILYPNPILRANIGRFLKGADMTAELVNPSGTAKVGALIATGAGLVTAPISTIATVIGGYGLSKLLFSQRGVNLLTQSLKPMTPAAASLLTRQIVNLVGPKGVAVPAAVTGAAAGQQQDNRPPLSSFHQ